MLRASDYLQKATYWGAPVSDGYGGHTFSKSTIYCRWEERVEEFTDQEGNVRVSRAIVWVQSDLEIGGYLYLGTSTQANPEDEPTAYRIKQFLKVPDLRNVEIERRVFL